MGEDYGIRGNFYLAIPDSHLVVSLFARKIGVPSFEVTSDPEKIKMQMKVLEVLVEMIGGWAWLRYCCEARKLGKKKRD